MRRCGATARASRLLDIAALRVALAGAKGPPIEPITPLPRLSAQPFDDAAVLIAIIAAAEPRLLLTRRRDGLRRHAGEISFPGGRVDPGDASHTAAALREAREEVGLPEDAAQVLGLLDRIVVGTGFLVTPVVALVPDGLPLAAQESEVAQIIEAPLAYLTHPANQRLETAEFAGRPRSFYVIEWQGQRIWGATARMLVELGKRIG